MTAPAPYGETPPLPPFEGESAAPPQAPPPQVPPAERLWPFGPPNAPHAPEAKPESVSVAAMLRFGAKVLEDAAAALEDAARPAPTIDEDVDDWVGGYRPFNPAPDERF